MFINRIKEKLINKEKNKAKTGNTDLSVLIKQYNDSTLLSTIKEKNPPNFTELFSSINVYTGNNSKVKTSEKPVVEKKVEIPEQKNKTEQKDKKEKLKTFIAENKSEEPKLNQNKECYTENKYGIPCVGIFEISDTLKKAEKYVDISIPEEKEKKIITSADESFDQTFSSFTKLISEKQENRKNIVVSHKKLDF